MIKIGGRCLNESIVNYRCAIKVEVLGQVLDTTIFRGIANFRCRRAIEFEIDGILSPYNLLPFLINISSGKMSRLTILS